MVLFFLTLAIIQLQLVEVEHHHQQHHILLVLVLEAIV